MFRLPLVVAAVFWAAAAAAQAPRPEMLIKWRQSVYQVLVWNSSRIRANVDGAYNRDEVVRAAAIIASLAGGGIGSLFPAGTERGRGWRDTTARPELFADTARVRELAASLAREADELNRLAQTADAAAVKAQYGRLAQACKACHDEFKVRE